MKQIISNGIEYLRIPVKTRILQPNDNFVDIINEFAKPFLQENDILVISESPLAITQGRSVCVNDVRIGFLAKFLWRFVGKVNYGTGLRSPTSMQCAIDECGSFRILLAAIIGGFSKIVLRRKGDFYRIAGKQAALIDAAHTSPVEGYQTHVIKGPLHPGKEAQRIRDLTGYETAIMDINDIGGSWVIGCSKGIDAKLLEDIMRDNPQGQGNELTPMCIVRKIL